MAGIDVDEMELKPHHIYLIKERKTRTAYQMLKRLLDEDHDCLCITRSHPKKLMDRYSLDGAKFMWLTGNKVPEIDTINPNEISRLSTLLVKFIGQDNGKKRAVLLDNMEYLVTQNSFEALLRVIHLLRDKVMLFPVIFLLPVDPLSLESKEVRLMEKECEVIDLEDY